MKYLAWSGLVLLAAYFAWSLLPGSTAWQVTDVLVSQSPVGRTAPQGERLEKRKLVIRGVGQDAQAVSLLSARPGWGSTGFPTLMPAQATLVLESLNPSPWERSERVIGARSLGDGALEFELFVDREYQIFLLAEGHAIVQQHLWLGAGSAAEELCLQLGDSVSSGTLELRIESHLGEPISEGLEVQVLDAKSGCVFLTFPPADPKDPSSLRLPPGAYVCRTEGVASIGFIHGTMYDARLHGGVTESFTIQSGLTTTLAVQLQAPSMLSLELLGEALPEDYAAIPSYLDEQLEREASLALVRLRQSGAGLQYVWFRREDVLHYGPFRQAYVQLGYNDLSEPLSPGSYTLEVSLPGGRQVLQPIELLPDEILPVSIDFGGR